MSPTEEIRAIRHQLAARFINDLDRIFAELLRQQQDSGREFVTLLKRPIRRNIPTALPREESAPGSGH